MSGLLGSCPLATGVMLPPRPVILRLPRQALRAGRGKRPRVKCMSNYRWSAEREGGGRRKRESLFDNLEPDTSPPQTWQPEANGSSRQQGGPAARKPPQQQQPRQPAWDVEAWDAGAWGTAAQGPSSSAAAPVGSGSWDQEPPPGVWDEWGPASVDASQLDDFGWAAPSWAGGSATGRQRQQPPEEPPGDGSGVGSSRGPGGFSSWDPAAHHAYGGSRWGAHAPRGPPPPGAAAAGDGYSAEGYGGEAAAGPGSDGNGAAGNGPGPAGGFYSAAGSSSSGAGGQYSDSYQPGDTAPDIVLLDKRELEATLPVIPSSQQADYFGGGATEQVQRWGASLALTVLLSKVALLAATTLTWPLWWPWALAGNKNYNLRKLFKYAGLWRTQVLEVEVTGRPKPVFGEAQGGFGLGAGFSTMRLAKFLIGDPGGARTEMTLPYDSRYELLAEGEPAELLVLSNDPTFETFKAVKDVYLPAAGIWLSEYPYADRTKFLEVSLEIEREEEAEAAQQAQQAPRSGSSGGAYY